MRLRNHSVCNYDLEVLEHEDVFAGLNLDLGETGLLAWCLVLSHPFEFFLSFLGENL